MDTVTRTIHFSSYLWQDPADLIFPVRNYEDFGGSEAGD
jgi:hypothetical protein